jgi:hypothetical protein
LFDFLFWWQQKGTVKKMWVSVVKLDLDNSGNVVRLGQREAFWSVFWIGSSDSKVELLGLIQIVDSYQLNAANILGLV